jgi:hypothetical protein
MKTRTALGISRREFLKDNAALAALTAAGPAAGLASLHASDSEQPQLRKMIGIQVGSVSFVDEGIGQVLDLLQERGAIDALFLTTFTYGRGLAGRQIPGHPFPDHGAQESDGKSFHGGDYATPHAEFYRHTRLKPIRAPDHGDLDIVAAVLPEARKRGMKLFCLVEDVFRNNHLLSYGEKAKLDELAAAGLSPDYVARETQRALAGVQGKCRVLPGIDIGIPTGKNSRQASPDDTCAATLAALKAGAHGVILSRKYSEMRLANLSAAGRAVRETRKG